MIYTIGLFDPLAVGNNRSALEKLARFTGGDSYFPVSIDELNPLWEEIQITFNPGHTPFQLFSDDEIADAAEAGIISLTETGEVYRCAVVGQKK